MFIKLFSDYWQGISRVAFVAAMALSATVASAAETYVPFRADLQKGTAYVIDAEKLHPTQFSLGWREVIYKTKAIDALSADELIAYFKEKDVPVVIGPGGVPYMSDGHHTTTALLVSKQPVKNAYGHIIANWSDLSEKEFWERMVANNYTNLKDEHGRGPQPPSTLPATLREMRRDPYRGLTWALLKAGGFKERKDVYFQEFFWADYLRDKVKWDDASEADFQRALKEASELVHAPEASHLPGYRATPKKKS